MLHPQLPIFFKARASNEFLMLKLILCNCRLKSQLFLAYAALVGLIRSKRVGVNEKTGTDRKCEGVILASLYSSITDLKNIYLNAPSSPVEYTGVRDREQMIVFTLKCILPLEKLRQMNLMPPPNCSWIQWVCCLGPCESNKDSFDFAILKLLRSLLLKNNRELFQAELFEGIVFEKLWAGMPWNRSSRKREGPRIPTILLPVNLLLKEVGEQIKEVYSLKDEELRNRFVCRSHFVRPGRKRDYYKNITCFTPTEINNDLKSGKVEFYAGERFEDSMPLQDVLNAKIRKSFCRHVETSQQEVWSEKRWTIDLKEKFQLFVRALPRPAASFSAVSEEGIMSSKAYSENRQMVSKR